MKTDDKGLRERFEKEVMPVLEHPLMEYHYGEGHERPKRCVKEDAEVILKFIRKELAQAERRGMDMVLKAAEGLKYPMRRTVDELGRVPTPTEAFEAAKERGYNRAMDDLLARFNGPQGKDN